MESRDGSPEQARAAQSQQSEHYEKAQAAVEATWVQPAQIEDAEVPVQPETPKQIEQAVAGVGAAPQSELAELLYSRRMEAAAEVALRSEHADPQSMEAVAEAVTEPCRSELAPSERFQHARKVVEEAEAQLEQAHPQESRWTGVAEEVVGRLEKTDSPHSLWEELAAQAVHAEPARPPQEQHSRFAPSQTEPYGGGGGGAPGIDALEDATFPLTIGFGGGGALAPLRAGTGGGGGTARARPFDAPPGGGRGGGGAARGGGGAARAGLTAAFPAGGGGGGGGAARAGLAPAAAEKEAGGAGGARGDCALWVDAASPADFAGVSDGSRTDFTARRAAHTSAFPDAFFFGAGFDGGDFALSVGGLRDADSAGLVVALSCFIHEEALLGADGARSAMAGDGEGSAGVVVVVVAFSRLIHDAAAPGVDGIFSPLAAVEGSAGASFSRFIQEAATLGADGAPSTGADLAALIQDDAAFPLVAVGATGRAFAVGTAAVAEAGPEGALPPFRLIHELATDGLRAFPLGTGASTGVSFPPEVAVAAAGGVLPAFRLIDELAAHVASDTFALGVAERTGASETEAGAGGALPPLLRPIHELATEADLGAFSLGIVVRTGGVALGAEGTDRSVQAALIPDDAGLLPVAGAGAAFEMEASAGARDGFEPQASVGDGAAFLLEIGRRFGIDFRLEIGLSAGAASRLTAGAGAGVAAGLPFATGVGACAALQLATGAGGARPPPAVAETGAEGGGGGTLPPFLPVACPSLLPPAAGGGGGGGAGPVRGGRPTASQLGGGGGIGAGAPIAHPCRSQPRLRSAGHALLVSTAIHNRLTHTSAAQSANAGCPLHVRIV